MKTKVTALILGLIFTSISLSSIAQNEDSDDDAAGAAGVALGSKYGKDSVKCLQNLSLYKEFVKQGNFDDALVPWRIVFTECPRSSKSIYTDGIKVITNQITKTKKPAYIDTLMMVYDQRIKYFGKDQKYPEGYVLGRKGVDLFKYRKEKIQEAYDCIAKSVELQGENSEAAVLVSYMQTTILLYKENKLKKENVVENYSKSMDFIEGLIKKTTNEKNIENLNKAKENVENLFTTSGTADCAVMIPLFTTKFNQNKEDTTLLKKITKLLDKGGCTESDLYAQASEQLNKLAPSALSAYNLARMFAGKGSYSKSASYYKQAIDLENDNIEKAKYYHDLAAITGTKLGQPSQGRSYAYDAIKLNPSWGKPYILIGNIYATCSNEIGADEFEHKAVFWAAIDKFVKAKSVDPSCAEDANKLINAYMIHYPNKEEGFFRSIGEGQSYTVGGWINETTTVRYAK